MKPPRASDRGRGRTDLRAPLLVLIAIHLLVLAADWIAPHDYRAQHRSFPLSPPALVQTAGDEPVLLLLGSDQLGRDQLSRLLHGGRISLLIGLVAGLLSVGLGLIAGAAAGHFGGVLDAVVMRGGELVLALPGLYLLIAVRALLPLDLTPTAAVASTTLLLALIGWVTPARLVRGVVLSARERGWVRAARGFGASETYLLKRHVLPATRGVVLTQLALRIPQLILAEVTLSFLGLGVADPVPSWGNMLAALRQVDVLTRAWWMCAPAVATIVVVLSYHQLANGLRRRYDEGAV